MLQRKIAPQMFARCLKNMYVEANAVHEFIELLSRKSLQNFPSDLSYVLRFVRTAVFEYQNNITKAKQE